MNKGAFVAAFAFLALVLPVHSSAAGMIELTALSSMERIGQSQEVHGAATVEIKAAINEVESFQVVVAAPEENVSVVKVEISDLVGRAGSKITKANIRLFREEYVRVRMSTPRAELPPELYPDPLIPFVNPETGKPLEPLTRTRKRCGEPATTTGHPSTYIGVMAQLDRTLRSLEQAGTGRQVESKTAKDGSFGTVKRHHLHGHNLLPYRT